MDGSDIRSIPPVDLRRSIAFVDQETTLLDRTVLENLFIGLEAPYPSMEEVIRATTQANAHEFITALEKGYHTRLNERGSRLSGGQIQRIQISRAILRKARVLILDEATSALDSENEAIVSSALETLMKSNMSTLVIAHRLATVKKADIILVLDNNGEIVERGTHAQLERKKGGLYAKLLQHQSMQPSTKKIA